MSTLVGAIGLLGLKIKCGTGGFDICSGQNRVGPGTLQEIFPLGPTACISSWYSEPSANMHNSNIARAPPAKSTITYPQSQISEAFPLKVSFRWLTSCPALAITRIGSAQRSRRIKSKKWQHFSTKVPPEFSLNRFQLLIFGRKGNLCSQIVSIFIPPVRSTALSMSLATGGIYLYSIATQTSSGYALEKFSATAKSFGFV